jgi:hypothetical protein
MSRCPKCNKLGVSSSHRCALAKNGRKFSLLILKKRIARGKMNRALRKMKTILKMLGIGP